MEEESKGIEYYDAEVRTGLRQQHQKRSRSAKYFFLLFLPLLRLSTQSKEEGITIQQPARRLAKPHGAIKPNRGRRFH